MRRWWLAVVPILVMAVAYTQPPLVQSLVQARPTAMNALTAAPATATLIPAQVTPTRITNHLPLVVRAGNTPTPTRVPVACAAEYPTVCIPPPPPDLNCTDIPYRNFVVLPPDRHKFDSDGDGIGCETK